MQYYEDYENALKYEKGGNTFNSLLKSLYYKPNDKVSHMAFIDHLYDLEEPEWVQDLFKAKLDEDDNVYYPHVDNGIESPHVNDLGGRGSLGIHDLGHTDNFIIRHHYETGGSKDSAKRHVISFIPKVPRPHLSNRLTNVTFNLRPENMDARHLEDNIPVFHFEMPHDKLEELIGKVQQHEPHISQLRLPHSREPLDTPMSDRLGALLENARRREYLDRVYGNHE